MNGNGENEIVLTSKDGKAVILDVNGNELLEYDAGQVVRVCADNPFVSASEVDRLINFYQTSDCDYAYNHIPRGNRYPDGLGAEITSFELLKLINREAAEQGHREHIFNYIIENQQKFKVLQQEIHTVTGQVQNLEAELSW